MMQSNLYLPWNSVCPVFIMIITLMTNWNYYKLMLKLITLNVELNGRISLEG